jgi:hypothetical protein
MITPEWLSAIAAVISIPISIWAVVKSNRNKNYIKKIEQKIIDNTNASGNVIAARDGNTIGIGNRK